MPDTPLQPRSNFTARLLGFAFFLAGVGAVYWQGYLPLKHAEEGQPLIQYSIILILFGLFFFCCGLSWMIFGLRAYDAVRLLKDRPKAKKMLMIVTFMIAALCMWGIHHIFSIYGYHPR